MNYRHAYHAGSFADVLKHMVLLYTLDYLSNKPSSFYVLDTHGGKGLYDLRGSESLRTAEASQGILALEWNYPALSPLASLYHLNIQPYLKKHLYPGSPLLIANLLRSQDRAQIIELHPQDNVVLKEVLKEKRNTQIYQKNGYQALKAFLPPKERRGLVLIDPPFEKPEEFSTLLIGVQQALQRFAYGTYIIWYPLKHPEAAQNFYESLEGTVKCLRLTYGRNEAEKKEGLVTAGLLIINPPFGLHHALEEAAPWLAKAHIGLKINVFDNERKLKY